MSPPVFSQLVILSFPEIRQAVLVVPAVGSFPLPPVVVFSVSTDVHHGVQRGRAAPDAAPRPVHHPLVHVVLRQSVVVPVIPETWKKYRRAAWRTPAKTVGKSWSVECFNCTCRHRGCRSARRACASSMTVAGCPARGPWARPPAAAPIRGGLRWGDWREHSPLSPLPQWHNCKRVFVGLVSLPWSQTFGTGLRMSNGERAGPHFWPQCYVYIVTNGWIGPCCLAETSHQSRLVGAQFGLREAETTSWFWRVFLIHWESQTHSLMSDLCM